MIEFAKTPRTLELYNCWNCAVVYPPIAPHIIQAKCGVQTQLRLLTVGTTRCVERLTEALRESISQLATRGVRIGLHCRRQAPFAFVDLDLLSEGSISELAMTRLDVTEKVAAALSGFIIDGFQKPVVRRILRKNYCGLTPSEREKIVTYVSRELRLGSDQAALSGEHGVARQISTALQEHFAQHSQIIVEGFTQFRLAQFLPGLENTVDRAVDSYMMEKEYREFISLLQYFVDTQKPSKDIIHVIVGIDGNLRLADEGGREIPNDEIDDLVLEVSEGDIDREDLLISNLITIAPRKVLIHEPFTDIPRATLTHLDTIRSVFGDRARVCKGCDLCAPKGAFQSNR